MKKTTKICDAGKYVFDSKLVIEIPHQREATIYTTSMKMTDYVKESSNDRFRDSLADLSGYKIMKNLGDIKDVLNYGNPHHQHYRVKAILQSWCEMNLYPEALQFLGIETEIEAN
jgi:hypothetical protein